MKTYRFTYTRRMKSGIYAMKIKTADATVTQAALSDLLDQDIVLVEVA